MIRKKNINWRKQTGYLSQAVNSGIEFAFVSDDMHQCTPFVYCRDYLQDAIQGVLTNKKKTIYGFKFNPQDEHLPSVKKTQLIVCNSIDKSFHKKMANCLDFLNQIETKLKIKKTKMCLCNTPPLKYKAGGVIFISGSKRWINSPPMISFYTLLIRIGFGYNPKKHGDYKKFINGIVSNKINPYMSVDHSRLKNASAAIDRIFNNGDRCIFHKAMEDNYCDKIALSVMHNSCGIVGLSLGNCRTQMPRWYKGEDK